MKASFSKKVLPAVTISILFWLARAAFPFVLSDASITLQLAGLSSNLSEPWGAEFFEAPEDSPPFPITITSYNANTTVSSFSGDWAMERPTSTEYWSSTSPASVNLHQDADAVVIGRDWKFSFGLPRSNLSSNNIPTVPFGINLGAKGVWNGSLTFGSSYDWNRVAGSSWQNIDYDYGNMAQNGSVKLLSGKIFVWTEAGSGGYGVYLSVFPYSYITDNREYVASNSTAAIIMDINHDAIVFPKGYNYCNQNISFLPNLFFSDLSDIVSQNYGFPIPANLTSDSKRCYESTSPTTFILGRPFFQANYMYLVGDGEILEQLYLSAAQQYDLPPAPNPFDPSAQLRGLPSGATQPLGVASSLDFSGLSIALVIGSVLFSMI